MNAVFDHPLPYFTADLAGVGGMIKRFNEDFLVEELPLYLPSGQGTHTYFTIEKQGLTTLNSLQLIARALGKRPHDIGYAGMKDAHGVTRQMLSVEHVDPARVASLALGRVKVLSVDRHTNKLKLGHLAGNRFDIKIRELSDTPESLLPSGRRILDTLARRGVPNYFGPQRFGARGDNARIGEAILKENHEEAIALVLGRPGPADHGEVRRARELFDAGDLEAAAGAWPRAFAEQARICRVYHRSGDARKAWRVVQHTLRKLYYSAFQSELFNRVVALRINHLDRVETGDLAWKHANGACFRVEDAAVEQPRCDALEISATGPLFGRRMTPAMGEPGRREAEILAETGLELNDWTSKDGTRFEGGRRPIRVPLVNAGIEAGGDDNGPYVRVSFQLPSGAYATNVTRELCKVTDL